MADISETLKKQIEAAFQYRGHVTVTFQDGQSITGYLYNREFVNPKVPPKGSNDGFIEVFLQGSGESARYKIDTLKEVTLTGADEAQGKSYQDWMKKQEKKAMLEAGMDVKQCKIRVTAVDGRSFYWHRNGKLHLLDEDLAITWVAKFKPHLFDILPSGELVGADRDPAALKIAKVEKVPADE